MFPYPTLCVNWGGTLRVHVLNNLQNIGTGIHFHGIRKNVSNPNDGASSILQCPIAPRDSITYEWKATQYGGTYYHFHLALPAWDGVFGGIVINGPASSNYDYDAGMLFINDWGHLTFAQLAKDGARQGLEDGERDRSDDQPPDQDRTRNEHIADPYQYSALTGRALSIRLAELLPGTRQEDIAIHLYETDLDESAGSYEALSYVWADTSEKTPILVDGQTLEIGANLRCALLNLRLVDKPRTVWIDAICIDQAKVDERNQQVAAMGAIYRQASQTVVWLCDQTQETAAAFTMLEDLAQEATSLAQARDSSSSAGSTADSHLDAARYLNNLPASIIERDGVHSPMFDRYKDDYRIMHVVASHWWSRAWTAQEILLASRATVMAGRYAMDWDRFCVGGNHGLRLGLWMPLLMGLILDPIVLPYLSVQALRWQRWRPEGPAATPAQELLDLLLRCRFRQATDPRDKVYALLGLAASQDPAPPLGIRPDYAAPASVVYTSAAQKILLASGTLDLLSAAGPASATAAADAAVATASWVPDWSFTDLAATPLLHDALGRPRATHAARHSAAAPQFLFSDGGGGATLVLRAHAVTTLAAVAPPLARIQFRTLDEIERHLGDPPAGDDAASLAAQLARLGQAWKLLAALYGALMSVVPHLATYADWEVLARAAPPTNPVPRSKRGRAAAAASASDTAVGSLIRQTSDMVLGPSDDDDDEPDDPLAVYWQTLCTGTYVSDDAAGTTPGGRGRTGQSSQKTATQQMFYLWRASLKPIRDLHRWRADRLLRPLAFVGYVRKTWRAYGEFLRLVEGTYGRRLARGANGYLCLVPAAAEVGDTVVLAEGGRVPLVVRRQEDDSGGGNGSGCWQFVGEAYVHGIMDGQGWDAGKCVEFKLR